MWTQLHVLDQSFWSLQNRGVGQVIGAGEGGRLHRQPVRGLFGLTRHENAGATHGEAVPERAKGGGVLGVPRERPRGFQSTFVGPFGPLALVSWL